MSQANLAELGRWTYWHSAETPLRLGVSTCLLGESVRFDGGHARDRFVSDTLSKWFEFVPVCPEVEIGMGIPRPTIRLVEEDERTRLVSPSTEEDFTERMETFSTQRVSELQDLELDGYVLKKGSPSCGMERIRVYRKGMPMQRKQSGLFAEALMRMWPSLPVEEDGRLNDRPLRENFIERAFSRNRWRGLVAKGLTRGRLVQFHTAHKLLVRAHNETAYQRLGKLLGNAGKIPDAELFKSYEDEFMAAMKRKATPKQHVNVLQHALGYVKHCLSPLEKDEILTSIETFRQGMLPLVVPLALLRYNIRRFDIEYLQGQLYFDPHPKELMLRNHV